MFTNIFKIIKEPYNKKKKKLQNDISEYAIKKTEGNYKELISLFKDVFKVDMSEEFWKWKYSQSYKHNLALFDENNSIVGHYGGMYRDMVFFGEHIRGVQVCDTMIAPSARGGKGKKSRLNQLISTFCETNIGLDRPYFLAYGFPNRRVMRVAELFNLYSETDRVVEYKWHTEDIPLVLVTETVCLKHKSETDKLWEDMKNEFKDRIIGVRDFEYIKYRYIDHPEYKYNIYATYNGKKEFRGILVGKKEDAIFRIMDIIALKEHYGELISLSKSLAYDMQCSHVSFWITKSQLDYFKNFGGKYCDMDTSIAAYKHINSCKLEDIHGKWWLTAGDTDFK